MGFIIYFMIHEIRLLIKLKLKYFYEFWSIIELGIIGCSWGSVGLYIWRYREFNHISQLFEQTNGYIYINLQIAIYINDNLTYLLGFSCFFSTIKFVHLCRFNPRLLFFTKTLQYAANELISFSLMFSIIFLAFLSLFYLLFLSKLESCADLLATAQMLFEMTLMKFDTKGFIDADAFLGPFCFALFIIIIVFVCLSMFLSIIIDNFRRARKNNVKDEDILLFMLKKFSHWTGNQI